jgi:hypothetical protein
LLFLLLYLLYSSSILLFVSSRSSSHTAGNIKFKGDSQDQASVVDPGPLNKASELLGVNPKDLTKAIVRPERAAGKGMIEVAKNPTQAAASRDALARQLYNRMFLWVVHKINQTFTVTDHHFIGMNLTLFYSILFYSYSSVFFFSFFFFFFSSFISLVGIRSSIARYPRYCRF